MLREFRLQPGELTHFEPTKIAMKATGAGKYFALWVLAPLVLGDTLKHPSNELRAGLDNSQLLDSSRQTLKLPRDLASPLTTVTAGLGRKLEGEARHHWRSVAEDTTNGASVVSNSDELRIEKRTALADVHVTQSGDDTRKVSEHYSVGHENARRAAGVDNVRGLIIGHCVPSHRSDR